MPFMKKKEKLRRENVVKANIERHARNRAQKSKAREPVLEPVGRRVVDLALLAREMWCNLCDAALSLKYLKDEVQFGLASKFRVHCPTCLDLKEVFTSSVLPASTDDGRSLFAVNCKAALGKQLYYLFRCIMYFLCGLYFTLVNTALT